MPPKQPPVATQQPTPSTSANAPAPHPRLHPLWELTRARLLESWREPEALFWMFVFPALLAVGLGIAFRDRPPEKARLALDQSLAQAAPELEQILRAAPERVSVQIMDPQTARVALGAGRIDLALMANAPPSAAKETAALALAYQFDASRPEARLARLAVDDVLQRGFGRRDALVIRDLTATQPGARYIDFLLPGLLGMNIMSSTMWSIGYSVVNERRRKLLKRYAATPMRRAHFLLSYGLSRLVFLLAEMGILLSFGYILFDITVHGSLAALLILAVVGCAAFSGLSLWVASRTSSAEVASGWLNFTMLPMWILSGTFFSADRFPAFMQPFIRLLPLTALNDALRSVMNEGASLTANAAPLGLLAVWAMVTFAIALRRFRWL